MSEYNSSDENEKYKYINNVKVEIIDKVPKYVKIFVNIQTYFTYIVKSYINRINDLENAIKENKKKNVVSLYDSTAMNNFIEALGIKKQYEKYVVNYTDEGNSCYKYGKDFINKLYKHIFEDINDSILNMDLYELYDYAINSKFEPCYYFIKYLFTDRNRIEETLEVTKNRAMKYKIFHDIFSTFMNVSYEAIESYNESLINDIVKPLKHTLKYLSQCNINMLFRLYIRVDEFIDFDINNIYDLIENHFHHMYDQHLPSKHYYYGPILDYMESDDYFVHRFESVDNISMFNQYDIDINFLKKDDLGEYDGDLFMLNLMKTKF